MLAVVVFYGLNDVTLDAPEDDAYDLVVALASGATDYQAAASQLASWLLLVQSSAPCGHGPSAA